MPQTWVVSLPDHAGGRRGAVGDSPQSRRSAAGAGPICRDAGRIVTPTAAGHLAMRTGPSMTGSESVLPASEPPHLARRRERAAWSNPGSGSTISTAVRKHGLWLRSMSTPTPAHRRWRQQFMRRALACATAPGEDNRCRWDAALATAPCGTRRGRRGTLRN